MRLDYGENAKGSSSFGLGLRHAVGDDLLLGANAFVDVVRTDNRKVLLGATLGLEAFTTNFDLRLNAHVPLSGSTGAGSTVTSTGVAVSGTQLVETRSQRDDMTGLLYGLTGEIGALFDSPFGDNQRFRAYAGAYVYDRENYSTEAGARLGLEYRISDVLGVRGSRFTLGAELVYDKTDKFDAFASARLRIPLSGGAAPGGGAGGAADGGADPRRDGVLARMDEGVRRDKGIRAGRRNSFTPVASIPVVNPTTGQAYGGIFFATQGGSGVGTFADPTSLSAAIAGAGVNGIVVVLGANGTITTPGVTLQNNQILAGGGTTIGVRLSDGSTTNFLLSGTAGTIDGDPGATTVTLASGALVTNLTLRGGTTVIGGNNVNGATLSNLTITDATDGIRITGAVNTTLSNLSFSNITGTSIFLNNQGATLSNITIDGGTNGIAIANNTGMSTLTGINVSNVTGDALAFTNNTGAINVTGFTATNTGDDAIAVVGGGAFTFAGATTITGLGAGTTSDGIDLTGTSNASLVFGDVDITGLGGGTGLNMAGADAAVTMQSLDVTGTGVMTSRGLDISGSQNGRVISIANGGTIANVGTGAVLGTNGGAFAAPDAVFTWGGGSIGGLAFALDGVGVNAANGSYGFGTTTFSGGFNFQTAGTPNYFISATATGTGDGSSAANRASIATAIAAASTLGTVNFILVNDGAAIDTAGGTFQLFDNQTLDTFGDGRTFASTGFVIAANITGSNLPTGAITITDPTGLGAATITNSSGAVGTIGLANGNSVRNITVGSSAGTAIVGSGIAGLVIEGVTVGGSTAAQNGISLVNTTGAVTLTNVAIEAAASGLSLTGASGTVTGNNVDISGANTLSVTGGNAAVTLNASSSVAATSGTAVSISGRIGGSFSHFGTVTANGAGTSGISVSGATAQSDVTFAGAVSLGQTTALGGGAGVSVDNNGTSSTVAFDGGLTVSTSGQTGVSGSGGGTLRVANIASETVTTAGAMALSLSGLTAQVAFDSLSATNANMTSVRLQNLDGTVSVTGGTLATVASGGTFNSFDVLQNDAGALRALTLFVDGLTITHDASGGSSVPTEHGLVVTTGGDDSATLSIANSTFRTEDNGVRVIATNGLATVTGFANNTLLGDATSFDPTLFGNGVMFQGVRFDASPDTPGLQAVNGGTFTAGSAGQSVLHGLFFDGTAGANVGRIDFTNYAVNAFGTGLSIGGGNPGLTVGIADGSISAGSVLLGNGTSVVNGDITLSSLTLTSTLSANQYAGSFTVTGATGIVSPERFTQVGADISRSSTPTAVSIRDSAAAFSFNSLTIGTSAAADVTTGGSTVGINLAGNSGTFTVTGTTTITNTVEDAIRIADTSGAIAFGQTVIVHPRAAFLPAGTVLNPREARSAAVDISGTIGGTISFADLDITLNSPDATGIELTGATINAAITANDFDLAGNGSAGTIGVDLRGATGGGAVRLGDAAAGGASSTIAGVDTGVWLDATTDAAFTFGDGENGLDQGSTISATTAINAAAAPTLGTYDFRDVAFAASPGVGFGTGRVYFVDADGATGGGDGTGRDAANPMTIAAAEAAIAAGDVIVLINNGQAINVAGTNGNNTLNLLDQVQLLSFGDGAGGSRQVTVNLTVPPTILLAVAGLTIDDPTGNGGAVMNTSSGSAILTLTTAGNRIDGVILDGAGVGAGGISASGANGLTIDRSILRNFNTAASLSSTTGLSVSNSAFSGNSTDIVLTGSTGGTLSNLTLTGASNSALYLFSATGTTNLTNVAIANARVALVADPSSGTITGSNVDVTNSQFAWINGGTGTYSFDAASTWSTALGSTFGNALLFSNLAGGSFSHAGAISATGSNLTGLNATGSAGSYALAFTGTVDFGTASNRVLRGVALSHAAGQAVDVSFADLDIAATTGGGLTVVGGGTLGVTTGSVSTTGSTGVSLGTTGISAGGITLTTLDVVSQSAENAVYATGVTGGAFTVTGTTNLAGSTIGSLVLVNSSANFSFGTTTISAGNGSAINLTNASGAVSFGGTTLDLTSSAASGIVAVGTNGTITFGNVDIVNLGSGTGLDLSGGTFDGQITLASLDITGTGTAGSKGIDLTGYDNTRDVVTTGTSSINNVQTGIDLTNANIANCVRFQFGDGSGTNPGTESRIDTTGFAVVTTGLAATGEFDLEDVAFGTILATTDISNLQGVSVYVVGTNGATGSGTGTFANPGTIAGAEASGASAIILVDNSRTGGDDGTSNLIDAATQGDGTLNLANGQVLIAMIGGQTVDLATLGVASAGAPASLRLTGLGTGTSVTASGAAIDSVRPILTSNAAAGTVVLAGSSTLQDVTIQNTGAGAGVSAAYSANATARIRASQITGGAGRALSVATTGGTTLVDLADVALTGGLSLDGSGGGTLTAQASGTNTITSSLTEALTLNTVVAAGALDFSQVTSTGDAAGIRLSGVSGAGSVTIGNAAFNRSGTSTTEVVSLTDLTMTGPLTIANLDIESTNTQSFAGVRTTGTSTSTINIGTGANGVTIDDTQFGLIFNGSHGTVNVGTAGAGMQIASRSTAITFGSDSTGTFAIGHAGATSAIVVNAGAALARGIESFNSDATITVTNIDINGTGTNGSSDGLHLVDNDASGSFSLTGTNTIDATGGDGVFIQNANASLSGLTLGGSASGAGNDISGDGIRIANSNAVANTVSLSNIVMGSGGAGDTGDIAGRGLVVSSAGDGVLTVSLTGTNAIRSTGQAMVAAETNAIQTANNVLLSVSGTTFESAASGVPSVSVTGQNVSSTTSTIGVRAFADNTVTGNGTGGGIRFEKVDFDGNGSGTAVAAGTLNVGQGTGNRVQGNGLAFVDTTGEIGFTTLNVYNNAGTGLLVDTKTNGLATVFTLNGGGSGTVDTTNGTALFLDPLTMNLAFGTVSSTNASGSGVYVEGGNATAAGSNALTIGTLNVSGSTAAGLRITNSVGTFTFGATTIANTGTAGGGVDIDVTNGDTLNVNFTGDLAIGTGAGTGLDVQSSGGSTVTMQTAAAATTSIGTTTGRLINTENLRAGAGGVTFDTLTASGTVAGHAVSLDLDAGAFSGGALSVAGTTGGHGVLLGGSGGTVAFDSATIANVANTFYGVSSAHAGTVTFTTVGISGSQNGLYTTGNGAVSVNGGTINVAGGRGVWIDGGSGAIAIAADISKSGAGEGVYVASRSGSTATISGNVTFTGGGASGIVVENNTAGTITFSGFGDLSTGANTAVSLTNNSSATVNFTGGLALTTTSGTGFSATGGGTVSLSGGTTRTISTATGRGVILDTVTVGASGINLQSIHASGTTSGNFVDLSAVSGGGFSGGDVTALGVTGTGIRVANSSAAVSFGAVSLGDLNTPGPMTYGIHLLGNSGSFTTTGSGIVDFAQTAGIRIENSTAAFSADFQAQFEVRNRNNVAYTAGGDGLQLNANSTATVSFAGFVFNDQQRGDASGASGQAILADAGGQITILDGSVRTNNNRGADRAAIDIRNTPGYAITLDSVVIDNDDVNETGGGLYLENNTGASFTIRDLSAGGSGRIATRDGTGVYANNTGTLNIGTVAAGAIATDNRPALIVIGTTVNLNLTTLGSFSSTGEGVVLTNVTGSVALSGNLQITNSTGPGLSITGLTAGSSFTVNGTSNTITSTSANAISLANNAVTSTIGFTAGTLALGTTTGIGISGNGTNGTVSFNDVDITGLTSGTGLRLTSTYRGAMTFNTLDITGTGVAGSKGIDLTGYANTSNVIVANPSAISNVQFGIDLTNATIANGVRFQYGDGDGAVQSSSINTSAVAGNVAVVVTGLGATGEFDLEDVDFGASNVSNLGGGASFFVVGSSGGSGSGTFADPGTIAEGLASGRDILVLIDDTANISQDTIDLGAGSLTLPSGRGLVSLANGETIDVSTLGFSGGGTPASLRLTGISSGGASITATGGTIDNLRPLLRSTNANGTVVLSGSGAIARLDVSNTGNGSAVYSNFSSGTNTVQIYDSTLRGGIYNSVGEGHGLKLLASGGTLTGTIARNDFISTLGGHIEVAASGSAVVSNLVIGGSAGQGNSFERGAGATADSSYNGTVTLRTSSSALYDVSFTHNDLSSVSAAVRRYTDVSPTTVPDNRNAFNGWAVVTVATSGTGTQLDVDVANNTFGNSGNSASLYGGTRGTGNARVIGAIGVVATGDGTAGEVRIDNNQIFAHVNDFGITVATASRATTTLPQETVSLVARVRNNTIVGANIDPAVSSQRPGDYIAVVARQATTACAEVSGNQVTFPVGDSRLIGIYVQATNSGTANIASGAAGSGEAAVAAALGAANTIGPSGVTQVDTAQISSGVMNTVVSCP